MVGSGLGLSECMCVVSAELSEVNRGSMSQLTSRQCDVICLSKHATLIGNRRQSAMSG